MHELFVKPRLCWWRYPATGRAWRSVFHHPGSHVPVHPCCRKHQFCM